MSRGRAVFVALLCGVVAGLIAHQVVGIPLLWAIALGLPAGTIALAGGILSGMADANWEAVPSDAVGRPDLHASSLSIRLSEAAGDQNRFVTRVRPRLARLAVAKLRTTVTDLSTLDDPRARELLGDELHTLLTDENARMPSPQRLTAMLARLEGT